MALISKHAGFRSDCAATQSHHIYAARRHFQQYLMLLVLVSLFIYSLIYFKLDKVKLCIFLYLVSV